MTRRPKLLNRHARNWLHLDRLRPVDDGQIVRGDKDVLEFEITVQTPIDLMVLPVCCLAQKLKQNGTKVQRYRHRRMQPMPTYLRVIRQKFECKSCGAALYEKLPDIADKRRMSKETASHPSVPSQGPNLDCLALRRAILRVSNQQEAWLQLPSPRPVRWLVGL